MSNVCHSGLDKREIDHMLLTLMSGEENGWLVDSNVSLPSSDSDDDKIYRPDK